MQFFKDHPLASVAAGIVIGVVFYSQIKRLPVVSRLPSK